MYWNADCWSHAPDGLTAGSQAVCTDKSRQRCSLCGDLTLAMLQADIVAKLVSPDCGLGRCRLFLLAGCWTLHATAVRASIDIALPGLCHESPCTPDALSERMSMLRLWLDAYLPILRIQEQLQTLVSPYHRLSKLPFMGLWNQTQQIQDQPFCASISGTSVSHGSFFHCGKLCILPDTMAYNKIVGLPDAAFCPKCLPCVAP